MRNIFSLLMITWCMAVTAYAQGIEFYHGTWEEALMKARAEDKIIFVDAYTTWCGPCKAMAANTFPDPEVGKFFNEHFISMKIDMEKEMGLEFRKKFPVTAYPTLFFIDYDQEIVLKVVGGKRPADLIATGQSVTARYDKSTKYETAYAAGDRSYQLVYDYIAALNKAGKPSVKIANDYLDGQEDLTTPENLKFILEAASQVDSRSFELMEKLKGSIAESVPEMIIQEKIRRACLNTAKRAIEFESPELITLAAEAMKRHIPSEAELFSSRSELQYALVLHDVVRIPDLVQYHVKKFGRNDPALLHLLALDLDKYAGDDPTCRALAIELSAKTAKERDAKTEYIVNYASLVYKSGSKSAALQILEEAMRRYDNKENKDYQTLKALKSKFENS